MEAELGKVCYTVTNFCFLNVTKFQIAVITLHRMVKLVKLFVALVVLSSTPVSAQENGNFISFDTIDWDFGKINESDGRVAHTFHLINTSSSALSLAEPVESCSCVHTRLSKRTLAPGEKAELEFIFDPAGARSFTYRTADLYDKSGNHLATLSIRADVVPIDNSLASVYPVVIDGSLRTDRLSANFGYCRFGERSVKLIPLANDGDKTISLSSVCEGEYLTVNCPKSLKPGEESTIELVCELPREGRCRSVTDSLYFMLDGKRLAFAMPVERIILPRIQPRESVPVLQTYPSVGKLTEAKAARRSQKVEYEGEIELRNAGKAPLEILEVSSSGTCSLKKGQTLAPGAKFKVRLRTEKREDRVEIFTNDPQRPYKELIFNILKN